MVKTQKPKRNRYRGLALIEAALVFPLLLLLTFGVIEYGWMFLKAQEITNAARYGARLAVRPGITSGEVEAAIDVLMARAGMADTGYGVVISPEDFSSLEAGDALNVEVTVPSANIAIMKNAAWWPLPANLGASVTMAKEGP
jgi:Flp pilus assembly protein TadG